MENSMSDAKTPSVDDVVSNLFDATPATDKPASAARPTITCTAAYDEHGNITLHIPVADVSKLTLTQKTHKPVITLAIPELNVTLRRADGKTVVKTGMIPYGTVSVMIRG